MSKPNVINLFMWGFQQHFHISINLTAERLFNHIDPKLKPQVFLFGVLVEDRDDRNPVCLEPEDCGYSVNAFSGIKELALQLEKVDEESEIFHSHPIAQANHNKKINNRSLGYAIRKILKKEDVYGDTEKYISTPTYVDGYMVFVVLEVQKNALKQHYSLVNDRLQDRYVLQRSLIESAINIYLKECSHALKDPQVSIGAIERDTDELMMLAGKEFMYSVSQAGKNFYGLHGLYDACNTIASLRYEGADGLGKLVIAAKDHHNIKLNLQLKEPIKISNFRMVRKFLELSNDNGLIISDSAFIYGLGKIIGKYNPKEESLFVVNFLSHYNWELLHDNNPLMVVRYRQPELPQDKINKDKFYSNLTRVFTDITKEQLDDLWHISIEATKQKHGTTLVITDRAKVEAQRLGKQSFALKPLTLNPEVISQVTTIDGAVLLDRNCQCHAIGVILDGIATENGNPARGARYNSSIRYYERFGKKAPTVLVIISEDGMINLIPDLRPQVLHSEIKEAIDEFAKISEAENPVPKKFSQAMNYFENLEFYLSEEECQIINGLRKKIEAKDSDGVRIVRHDLKPHKEMNSSYFIKE